MIYNSQAQSGSQSNIHFYDLLKKSKINEISKNEARKIFQDKYTEYSFHVVGPFVGDSEETDIEESGQKA